MKTNFGLRGCSFAMVASLILLIHPGRISAQNPNKGEEIRNKVGSVIANVGRLTANLDRMCPADCQSKDSGRMFKAKIDRIKVAHGRLAAAHGRTNNQDFQETLRKKGKGKSQGCDGEFQICDGQGGNNIAVQAGNDYDDDAGSDLVGDLNDVDAGLNDLNAILENNNALAPPDPDFQLAEADFFFPTSMRPSDEASFAAFLAQMVAVKAVAIGTHLCDQTAVALGFGGNGAAVCAVSEGIAQVVSGVYETMAFMDGSFQGAEITTIYKRTRTLFDQASKTDGQVDLIKESVQRLEEKLQDLERNQMEIIRLLNMPQGQRPAFPKP